MARIGQSDIKKIWGIAKSPQLRLSDEELHLVVAAHTGKDSIRALHKTEMKKVVRALLDLKDSAKRQVGEAGGYCVAGNQTAGKQRRLVFKLAQELGWDGAVRVNGMCRKMFGIAAVEWLSSEQCSKLIEALKAMLERKKRRDTVGKEAQAEQQGEKGQCTG